MNKLHVSRRTVVGSLGAGLLMTASRAAFAAPVTLEALKKAGEVKVGCEAAYVPFTYRDNTGKIIGFDVDFAAKMLRADRREAGVHRHAMVRRDSGALRRAASTWFRP